MEIDTANIEVRQAALLDAADQGTDAQRAQLMRLVLEWEQSARSQFQCGERTTDPMGKRLVEHGAVCYFNCAQALRTHLASDHPNKVVEPPPLTEREKWVLAQLVDKLERAGRI